MVREDGITEHVKVRPSTKEELDSLKVVPEQTYDSVINGLILYFSSEGKKNGTALRAKKNGA